MDINYFNLQNPVPRAEIAPSAPKNKFEHQARKSADEFEAIFLSQFLKQMSSGLKTDGEFNGGHSESLYRDLLNEQMANSISRNGGLGLSDAVYREILKTQEVSQ